MTRSSSKHERRSQPAQRTHQSLRARLRALTGWTRIVVFGVPVIAGLAIIAAIGSTAYALQLENHDAFCASCHTQPESQYFQQSLQQAAPTLAAFHTQKDVRCIDCHSGSGPFGRMVGLSQGTQDLIAYYSGHYHTPAITTNKLSDGSCTKCHADIATLGGFNNHFHRFLAEWQAVDPNAAHCMDCHTSHSTADPTQGYLAQTTVQAVCQACHAVAGRG
jgi:hypothetical protein